MNKIYINLIGVVTVPEWRVVGQESAYLQESSCFRAVPAVEVGVLGSASGDDSLKLRCIKMLHWNVPFRLVGDLVRVGEGYWEHCQGDQRGSAVKAVTAGHKYVWRWVAYFHISGCLCMCDGWWCLLSDCVTWSRSGQYMLLPGSYCLGNGRKMAKSIEEELHNDGTSPAHVGVRYVFVPNKSSSWLMWEFPGICLFDAWSIIVSIKCTWELDKLSELD